MSEKADAVEEAPVANDFVVDWEGEDDPENPLNWSSRRKAINVACISCLTFVTYVPGNGPSIYEHEPHS